MNAFELGGPADTQKSRSADYTAWTAPRDNSGIRSGLDWALSQYGAVAPAAADLLHIAAAAYVADGRTRRPTSFTRTIDLVVHVHWPDVWTGSAGATVVELLNWISGDRWTLHPVPTVRADSADTLPASPPKSEVMLLSGGLDSFCGATDRLASSSTRLHIGHIDSSTAVQHAQKQTRAWLVDQDREFSWLAYELREGSGRSENTTRTRSLLFMAMAIAAATGCGASAVVVPENGFTSMNLPLQPSRGGALSTKSTHPFTFSLLERLGSEAGLGVTVGNPYISLTKGEFLKQTLRGAPASFLEASAKTLSCAKLDAGRFKGSSPNLNCGLCYACLVRRGAYIASGNSDPTEYALERLAEDDRSTLIAKRRDDLWAIRYAAKRSITIDDLISSASWPSETDLDAVLDLVKRGRQELFSVPLP